MTPDRYDRPDPGTPDWHEPLNDNFADLDAEVLKVVEDRDAVPDPGDVTASRTGQWPRFLDLANRVQVRVTDETDEIVGGLGSADRPLPEQHVESLDATDLYTDGRLPDTICVQRGDQYVAYDHRQRLASGTDGIAVAQVAVDECPENGTVLLRGTYETDGHGIAIGDGKRLLGHSATIDLRTAEPDAAVYCRGDRVGQTDLTSPVDAGSTTVQVEDASGIEPDHLVFLSDDRDWGATTGNKRGEGHLVADVDGDRVELAEQTVLDYDPGSNGYLAHVRPDEAHVEGLTVEGPGADVRYADGIVLDRTIDSTVRDCRVERCGFHSIGIRSSYAAIVEDNVIQHSRFTASDTSRGYGVGLHYGNANVLVTGNRFHDCRHAVSLAGAPGRDGLSRDVLVTNNRATAGNGSVFDAHGAALSVTWADNVIHADDETAINSGAYVNRIVSNDVYGGSVAFSDRANLTGTTHIVRDNRIRSDGRVAKYDEHFEIAQFVFEGNVHFGESRRPLQLAASEIGVVDLRIVDNVLHGDPDADDGVLYAVDVRTAPTGVVEISDNELHDCYRGGVRLDGGSNPIVTDNVLVETGWRHDSDYGNVWLQNTSGGEVKRNTIVNEERPTANAVRIDDATDVAVENNRLRGTFDSGITIDDSPGSYHVENSGFDDSTGQVPSDPAAGTKYLDDGSNRDGPGYRLYVDGRWVDL